MSYLCDTHCHLYLEEFAGDLDAVMQRADTTGIRKILVPGIDAASSAQAVDLSHKYPDKLYAAVGIHPNYASQVGTADIAIIQQMLENNVDIKAIGEIGLDYYRTWASREDQIFVFQQMLDLASRFRLPICIHVREAEEDILKYLEIWYTELEASVNPLRLYPGVFHSFSGNPAIASWAFNHHFLFGISGPVTFKNAQGLRDSLSKISIEHIIMETDSPYLAPHPHRGKRNEPAYVNDIAEEIAKTLEMEFDEVAAITSHNAQDLFKWDDV